MRVSRTTGASLASYDHVSSTIKRNVGASVSHDGRISGSSVALGSREWSVSSRIEDAGLVADVSMQDSQSKGGRKCLRVPVG